ncbi:hypothetical protein B0H14DRAFT_2567199 [Mycena olivaceomarginata]|nr:hypothetical protein B0H14DRAFT_2567199 [Mycena olivaceomarginata]
MRARTVGNLHRGVGLESHRTPTLHLSSFLCLLMLGGRMEVCAVAHEVSEVTGNSISTLGRGCRGGWQQMGVWVPSTDRGEGQCYNSEQLSGQLGTPVGMHPVVPVKEEKQE